MGRGAKRPRHLCNVEAEASLLGAALIGGEEVLGFPTVKRVDPSDFWDYRHRDTWAAILEVVESGLTVDFLTVADELEKRGRLDAVGGVAFLTTMINACLSVMRADSHAVVVLEWSRRRKVEQAISGLGAALYKDGDFEGALGEAIVTLNAVKQSAETLSLIHI